MSAARPPIPIFAILAVVMAVLFGAWIPLEVRAITNVWQAISSEPYGALFGHALIGIVVCGGLVEAAIKRRVLPLPQMKLLVPLAFLELGVLATILVSEYRHISIASFLEWTCYLAVLILTVGTVGRGPGVRMVLGAMAAAIVLMSIYGINEWIDSARSGNPSWRIFAHTLGPNVAAAFFAIGATSCLGFIRHRERAVVLLSGLGAFLCVVALLMTGSKGGALAVLAAVVFYGLWHAVAAFRSGSASKALIPLVAAVAIFGLAFGFTNMAAQRFSSAGKGTMSRVAEASASQEQSAGFRRLLWQGTASLIAQRPYGYGLSTYRFYSARPGLTTPTQLSHNSYLQLAMEASPIALLGFVGFLIMLAKQVFRGTGDQTPETRDMKIAVAAGIVAVAIHSMIDSDLQIFGVGILFFVLCGLAIQLSTDSSAPEFLHPGLRKGLLIGGTIIPIGMLYFGLVDLKHGLFLATPSMTPTLAKEGAKSLESLAPLDSRVAYLNFQVLQSTKAPLPDQIAALKKAIALGPTFGMYRAMADLLAKNPGNGDPIGYLDQGLSLDPNNLPSLALRLRILAERDQDLAKETAERLVAVESSTYYKTRSLPELIPVETFDARAFLAQSLSGSAKVEMLKPAVLGYQLYAKVTVPRVVEFAKANLPDGFGGITPEEARAALENGRKLIADYRSVSPDDKAGSEASSAVEEALGALASLSQ